jgi:hypothetical protein
MLFGFGITKYFKMPLNITRKEKEKEKEKFT